MSKYNYNDDRDYQWAFLGCEILHSATCKFTLIVSVFT